MIAEKSKLLPALACLLLIGCPRSDVFTTEDLSSFRTFAADLGGGFILPGEPELTRVTLQRLADGTYQFNATLLNPQATDEASRFIQLPARILNADEAARMRQVFSRIVVRWREPVFFCTTDSGGPAYRWDEFEAHAEPTCGLEQARVLEAATAADIWNMIEDFQTFDAAE